MTLNYQTVIVNTPIYTVATADEVILVNVTSAPALINLPTPSNPGRSIYIKDYSGTSLKNPITIKGATGKLINGVSFALLNGNYSHIQIVYDGINWLTIS